MLSEATRDIFQRLFNALWREQLCHRRRLEAGPRGLRATMEFPAGGRLTGEVVAEQAMDRLLTAPPYLLQLGPERPAREAAHPAELLELLGDEAGQERLAAELRESATNLEEVLQAARGRAPELASLPGDTLLDKALGQAALPPEHFLEGWILRGHTLHPGTKTRTGFDAEDLRRYAPELTRRVDLRFVAVRRDHLVETTMCHDEPWGYPAPWRETLEGALTGAGLEPDGARILALHPWQSEHVLPRLFERELQRGILVPLEPRLGAIPLASLRTLAPAGHPAACQLKVPLAVQITSALRTVSAQSAQNGPRLSDLIQPLHRRLPDLREVLELQVEPAGLHFWPPGRPPEDPGALEQARHLSMLFRRPPRPQVGAPIVPAALLPERSPVSGRSVASELACAAPGGPEAFLEAYALVTGRALLPPLLQAGLALEAHAQNCLIRLRGGLPAQLIVRDLGGIRLFLPWLEEAGLSVRLHPASVITARDPGELVAKSQHCWLQGHLAPMISALATDLSLPEARLWSGVARTLRQLAGEILEEVPVPRRALLEELMFQPQIQVKALTRMRLRGASHDYDFCPVANPLHPGGEGA